MKEEKKAESRSERRKGEELKLVEEEELGWEGDGEGVKCV